MTKKPSSKSPGKQRRKIYKSPLHSHKNMLKCRLDEFLREEFAMRSIVPKKGDLVRIMRGQFRDTEGKILGVDYGTIRLIVDSATTTKADGKEVQLPIHPSNVLIVKLEMDDERKKAIERKTITIAESD
ncbi:MAG: 50S ribosomal protein L24 [Candidatus Thorarchaeota archaeon]